LIIGIVGGTAGLGFSLAVRLAVAGYEVLIGSRSIDKAKTAAEEAKKIAGQLKISGDLNENICEKSDIVFFAIPFNGLYLTAKSLKNRINKNAIVVSTIVPLESDLGGGWKFLEPSAGSAAETLSRILGRDAKVVSALNYAPAAAFMDLDSPVECDVIVCGEREHAMQVIDVIEHIPNLRGLYGGGLENSRITERMTPLLIFLNKEYSSDRAGIRVTYIEKSSATSGKR